MLKSFSQEGGKWNWIHSLERGSDSPEHGTYPPERDKRAICVALPYKYRVHDSPF